MSTNFKEDDRVLMRLTLSSPLTSALCMARKEARSLTFLSVGFIGEIHNVIDAVSKSDRKSYLRPMFRPQNSLLGLA